MVTMLIVDDDTFECECIKSCIDWELIGIHIIGEAINGSQGLNKVIELNPDIVLTDVKMPVMDGIEMSKKVKTIAPETKIIFFSAYDDFEFAKQAIDLKASAYVTKPVNEVELLKIVKRTADEITERTLEKNISNKMNRNYKISFTLARQAIVNQVLNGMKNEIDEAENMGLGWLFSSEHLCLLLSVYEKGKVQLIANEINLLNERCGRLHNRSISICVNAGVLITLASFGEEIREESIQPLKDMLLDFFAQRNCKDVRVEAVYENGQSINPSDLFFKIIQNSVLEGTAPVNTVLEGKKLKKQIVAQIEQIIHTQYNKPLTIESIAKMIHFTPNYISSIFKMENKISINRYLMNIRLEKAEELLKDENLQLSDIALQCGYENITYFHTIFKKEHGITPSEYRRHVLSEE